MKDLDLTNKQAIGDIYEKERRRNNAPRSHVTSFEFEADVRSQYCLCGMSATTSIRFLSCWEMSDERRHGDIEGISLTRKWRRNRKATPFHRDSQGELGRDLARAALVRLDDKMNVRYRLQKYLANPPAGIWSHLEFSGSGFDLDLICFFFAGPPFDLI